VNKKILDITLLILFFVCLSSNFVSATIHEVCGVIFICAIFAHNYFNRAFYKNFSKIKRFNRLGVIFFAVSLIFLTVSGIMLWTGDNNLNWRSMHLCSSILALMFLFVHLLIHARKYIYGKIFYTASMAAFVLAVAGIFGLPYLDRWFHKVEVNAEAIVHGKKIFSTENILTVYFSRVGNTNFPQNVDAVSGASLMLDNEKLIGNSEMIAYMARDIVGGDLLEIQTEKIYPADYPETTQVAKTEFDSGELPKIKNLPDLKSYEKIILIYPLWWSKLPKPVESFLRSYDLSGKIIVPIVTHGGGGLGESIENLKSVTNAKVFEPALDIYSSDIPASREEIFVYLNKNL